ncbi:MAG TPA: GreA/GreB family elongation factor [Allosphingosinicella sp.]|jgi:transcription elongation GreA/GreB family factor
MSVAFRRESDEEHKEPRFELPLPPGPNLVTSRGLEQIRARVTELEARVAEGGEETPLAEAKRDLRYWQTRQATAQLAPAPAGDEVAFGTRVRFRLNGGERTLAIVGDDESDPANGYLSFSAPLAQAMIGACAGDFVDFGGKTEAIEILDVSVAG